MIVMERKTEASGILLALISTFLWSLAFICSRFLVNDGSSQMDPFSLAMSRFIIGPTVILSLGFILKKRLLLNSWRQIRQTALMAFFFYWLMTLLLFYGVKSASATVGALYVESGPALLVIIWKMIRRKKVSRSETAAVILGVLGSCLVLNIFSNTSGFSLTGQLCLLGSAICWVAGSFIGEELMKADNIFAITAWSQIFSGLYTIPVLLIFRNDLFIPTQFSGWLAVLVIGIFPTALAFLAWSYAMSRVPIWKLALMQNLTPIFTLFGAAILIGEAISLSNLLGILLVVSGLSVAVICNYKKPEKASTQNE